MLLVMSFLVMAPLEEQATVNVTPHVAKAPWYFLGLQEMLAYFNPTIAGIFIPTDLLHRSGAHRVRRQAPRSVPPATGR